MIETDVLIIGAGAAGMMCAIEAGKRGRAVALLDHAKKPGEKIRISGGGRCNFTNTRCSAKHFISSNPHFAKSALAQYKAQDFINLVNSYNIGWHEKSLGQLFCNNRSSDIIEMLLSELDMANVDLLLEQRVNEIRHADGFFYVHCEDRTLKASSLVIATGGKSIPKMGATGFGYNIARQFGLNVGETRPALVPFTFDPDRLTAMRKMAGLSFDCTVRCGKTEFSEAALFTHRGLSGPAMLQISSYWREGMEIFVKFSKADAILSKFDVARKTKGKQEVHNWLAEFFPAALAKFICSEAEIDSRIAELSKSDIARLKMVLTQWQIKPAGSEGYRTAEVTLGGVDTNELNSRDMQSKKMPGLFFIGEVVDVTGWLGGYNFQWAWSSGWAAGQVV